MIAAILRAQLLSMRVKTGTRRGAAIFSVITGLVFYGFWGLVAWGGMRFFADPENASYFAPTLSSGLLLAMIYWQFVPVISASFGASLDLRKLLAYPIPHGTLFTAEVLLRITACAEMLLVAGGAAIGLLRDPLFGLKASPFIAGGALIFTATNILLSAGMRNLVERLFLRTRLKQVMLAVIVIAGLLPQFLLFLNVRRATLLKFVPSRAIWPWVAAAKLMLHESVTAAGLLAFFYLAVAWWFGRTQFERSLRYDRSHTNKPGRATRGADVAAAIFQLPDRLLPDPLAALVGKDLRTLARIARFRFLYAMSCVFGIVLYLPWMRRSDHNAFMLQNALPVMALYGLLMLGQISYWNSFGFDRSAVQGYFSWPIRFRDALVAKNIAVALLLLPQIAAIAIIGHALHLPSSPGKILEAAAVSFIAALYWCTVGNIVSVRMPRALDPEKMNQMSNKLQALSILSAPLLLFPIGLAYWARAVFESEWIFSGMLFLAALAGAVFYWIGLESAAGSARRGRESMVMQLSKSGGPLSSS